MLPFKLLPKPDNHSRQPWRWSQDSSQRGTHCALVGNLCPVTAQTSSIQLMQLCPVAAAFTIFNFSFFDLELENTFGHMRQYNLQPTSSVNAKAVLITSEKSWLFQHAAKVVRVWMNCNGASDITTGAETAPGSPHLHLWSESDLIKSLMSCSNRVGCLRQFQTTALVFQTAGDAWWNASCSQSYSRVELRAARIRPGVNAPCKCKCTIPCPAWKLLPCVNGPNAKDFITILSMKLSVWKDLSIFFLNSFLHGNRNHCLNVQQ